MFYTERDRLYKKVYHITLYSFAEENVELTAGSQEVVDLCYWFQYKTYNFCAYNQIFYILH